MYKTGNPVPSSALEDMADNAQTFDALVTKTEGTTTDRLGRTHRVFQQILMDMGFQPLSGSFQTGATITARNQALYDEVSHVFYAWGGALPKVVIAGSTPATAGGIGAGLWVDRTDLTVRSDITSGDFLTAEMSKYSNDKTVQQEHDSRVKAVVYASEHTFNANGITDDTANFTALESSVTHKIVDLLGADYYVTAIPTKNKYINGRFVTPTSYIYNGVTTNSTKTVNATLADTASPLAVVERDLRVSVSRIAYKPVQTAGLQGLCFDEPNRHLYSMYFDKSSGSERTVICRYSMDALDVYPTTVTADLTTIATTVVGHQGLSLEYITNNTPKLWSAVRYDATNYPLGHRQVARFNVTNAADVSNLQLYTLFGAEFSYTGNSTMAAVSYDQRWLVAVGRKGSRDFWVRVFDLNMLVDGGAGDYSDKYSFEFNLDVAILGDDAGGAYTPVQNVACDGNFVYILAGNATQQHKKVWQYTLSGLKVGENSKISVGLSQSQTDGTFYEPEALAFYKAKNMAAPSLAMLILTSGKNNYIYQCGGEPIAISDTWTPTLTAVTNIGSLSVSAAMYQLQDGYALMSGRIVGTSPETGSFTFRASLPFGHIDTSLTQAQGTFGSSANAGGRIQLDTSTGTLDFTGVANSTSSVAYSFMCMMRVVN